MRNTVAKRGALLANPPHSASVRVPVRSCKISIIKNNPTTLNPWFTIWMIAPCNPSVFQENTPAEISPTCAIEEYAIKRLASCCLKAMIEAYTIPITQSTMTTWLYANAPSGATGNNQRINPYTPILSMIPANSIVPAAGACVYVSGCQVWKGKIGILIANARKNAQNIQRCVDSDNSKATKEVHSKLGVALWLYR